MTQDKKALVLKIEKGALVFNVDPNKDGESVIKGKLDLGEAVSEAFKREGAIEGVKLVDFRFEVTKLYLKLDTDRDGESVLELEIDLAEAFDEIKDLIDKKG